MIHGDILALPFRSGCFDLIVCYHVLEHVPDDRHAMRVLRRVLSDTGTLFVHVPIEGGCYTVEDPSITDPVARLRAFGQSDHVRMYGRDFVDRLVEAGFNVNIHHYAASLPPQVVRRYGLLSDDLIYACVVTGRVE